MWLLFHVRSRPGGFMIKRAQLKGQDFSADMDIIVETLARGVIALRATSEATPSNILVRDVFGEVLLDDSDEVLEDLVGQRVMEISLAAQRGSNSESTSTSAATIFLWKIHPHTPRGGRFNLHQPQRRKNPKLMS